MLECVISSFVKIYIPSKVPETLYTHTHTISKYYESTADISPRSFFLVDISYLNFVTVQINLAMKWVRGGKYSAFSPLE